MPSDVVAMQPHFAGACVGAVHPARTRAGFAVEPHAFVVHGPTWRPTARRLGEISVLIFLSIKVLGKHAETEVEKRNRYSSVSTPLHIFGEWHNTNAYDALLSLALTEDQPVPCTFGTDEEKSNALTFLKSAKRLALDLSAVATLRLLRLEYILKTTHFQYEMSEHTWLQVPQRIDRFWSDSDYMDNLDL